MRYFDQLRELRQNAGEPQRVPQVGRGNDLFVDRYLAKLAAEKTSRSQR